MFRQIAGRRVWIGNVGDLRNLSAIFAAEIQAVVELADNEQPASLPRELIRYRFPISDGGDNPTWLLRLAVTSVADLIRSEISTLICCSNGLSRSVSIASAAVAVASDQSIEDVLSEISAAGPADVSPRLLGQIKSAASNLR